MSKYLITLLIIISLYLIYNQNNSQKIENFSTSASNRSSGLDMQRNSFSGPSLIGFNSVNYDSIKQNYNYEPTNIMLVSNSTSTYLDMPTEYNNDDFFDTDDTKSLLMFGSLKNIIFETRERLNNINLVNEIPFKFIDVKEILDLSLINNSKIKQEDQEIIDNYEPLIVNTINVINKVGEGSLNIDLNAIVLFRLYINSEDIKLLTTKLVININHPLDKIFPNTILKVELNINYVISNNNIYIKDLYIQKLNI